MYIIFCKFVFASIRCKYGIFSKSFYGPGITLTSAQPMGATSKSPFPRRHKNGFLRVVNSNTFEDY